MVSAAVSVVGKALDLLTNPLLKNWAASVNLGLNVEALQIELLTVQALLEHTSRKEVVDNTALSDLLLRLQDMAYDAEDVLDELDYFRIQDQLHGTSDAAEEHAKGWAYNLALHAKAVGKQIICLPCKASSHRGEVNGSMARLKNSRVFCNPIHAVGKHFPCTSQPSVRGDDQAESDDSSSIHNSPHRNQHRTDDEPSKLRFDRVEASKRMQRAVQQLRLVRENVSGIIATLGSSWSTASNVAQSRPITNSESIEPKLYGRGLLMDSIVLDIDLDDINDLPRDMSNLIKLRHFLVPNDETHSRIVEVGRLESLQELRSFMVKKEGQGFELRQIGHLVELRGLHITNLENVRVKEEADEAKLMQKIYLHELILCWTVGQSSNDYVLEEHVLERFKPSSNLLKLSIIGHGGDICPSWLSMNLSITSLESLCLDGVAWKTFPPIGELLLVNGPREEISGKIPDKRFGNLRMLELVNLPRLKRWAVDAPCQLFPFLEALVIRSCSELVELSFSHSTCCQQEKEAHATLFPKLSRLKIYDCPQLLSFPPVPWTEAPCSIQIERTGHSCLDELACEGNKNSDYSLTIRGNGIQESAFWNVLDYHNLAKLKEFTAHRCQPMPLHYLQMLSSLRELCFWDSMGNFPFVKGDSHVQYQFPVELVRIDESNASGKELTQLFTYFPKLSDLGLLQCKKITGLGVMGQQATAKPGPSLPANKLDEKHDAGAEEILEEGLLLVPPQLQALRIFDCPELILHYSNPLDDNKQCGQTGGGGLQGLSSLRRLHITGCPKLLFSYSSYLPFPKSLDYLLLADVMETVAPLSNLSFLTSLIIHECRGLRGAGLLSQGHLTRLEVCESPNFFVDSVCEEELLTSRSSKLQELIIDDVAGVPAAPICSFLFSSLTTLEVMDIKVEIFTEEQEALLLVNSLEKIVFGYCMTLQYLPKRLQILPNLQILAIVNCDAIQVLPLLPSSLQKLDISNCPEIQSLSSNHLPSSLQKLEIHYCPAIRFVPMPKVDDLPNSLHELYVHESESEELRRQCRKFIGIVPMVRV
ncbi:hypothetical protein HU200_008742 [Digitaria exilis]|uniref:Rx N-terminal domain-containing protein n=1 Tax=Digitaria exilis TaxID=1010633 RepID=A0A835KR85_9POAL|nr:hypothetical protein HU200_008742 [Digitaria exilis]